MTEVVFRLKTEGGGAAAADVSKIGNSFSDLAKSAAATNTATVALAKSLNSSFGSAQKFADSLGLTAEEAARAAARLNELKAAGATGAQAFKAISSEVGITQQQFRQLSAELKDPFGALDLDGLPNKFGATTAEIENQARSLQLLQDQADKTAQGYEAIALSTGGLLAAIGLLGANALQTGAQFEQLQSALNNALGGAEQGAAAFERIQAFAASTPFAVDQLTASFLKLVNRGFTPTNEELTRLGDLASSQAKDFDQLVEALLDAQTGEFERLKEFGIQASKSGDQVTFSFRGLQQTVANTPEAISQVILGFGELEGIQGSLAAQSATLNGQLSNLGDGAAQVGNQFFEFAEGPVKAVVGAANALIGAFLDLPEPIQGVLFSVAGVGTALLAAVAVLSAYQVALKAGTVEAVSLAAAQIRGIATTTASTATKSAAAAAETAYALATGRATAAQVAQAQAFAGGAVKVGLFAAAIAAVAIAVDTFNSINSAASETEGRIDALASSIQNLKAAQAELGNTSTQGLDNLNTSLEANRQAIEDNVNGLQQFLDQIRQVFNATTVAEAAVNKQSIAFGDLVQTIDGEVLGAFDRLKAAPGGLGAAGGAELDALKSSIEGAIAALEAEKPVSAEAAAAREVYINSLKQAQSELEATTQAAIANADATQLQGAALEEFRRQASTQLDQQNADNERQINRTLDDERAARQEAIANRIAAIQQQNEQVLEQRQQQQAQRLNAVQQQFDAQQEQFKAESQRRINEETAAFDQAADDRKAAFQASQQALQDQQNQQFEQEQSLIDQQLAIEQLRDQNLRNQTASLDAEEQAVQQRIQLAAAATPEERRQLQDRFEQENEATARRQEAERRFQGELTDIAVRRQELQFAAEQEQAARRAELEAPLEAARAAAEEQRRQAEAAFNLAEDQRRLEFEQNVLLPLQQQLEATLEQRKLEFETNVLGPLRAQQEADLTALRRQQEEELSAVRRAAAAEEQRLERQAEDDKIAREREFKQQQRELDKANAEEIVNILRSAGIQAPNGQAPRQLRRGGTVEGGEVVQLHKDELVLFNRPGTVLNQRDSRAVISQIMASQRIASPVVSLPQMGASDPRLIKAVVAGFNMIDRRLAAVERPQQTINLQQGSADMGQVFALMRQAARY